VNEQALPVVLVHNTDVNTIGANVIVVEYR
jgi:hypothetical protein